jgi:transcriptional regulator with XRE-family HTH domain
MRDLAAFVRGQRQATGLSQAELARRAGMARKTVLEIESGTSRPSFESVLRIVDAFDLVIEVTEGSKRRRTLDLDEHLRSATHG